jgi:predicted deacetylase
MKPALVVSIHDVSPLTRDDAGRMLADLRELGVPCVSLLVVPDHHHRGHFLDDAAFCEWLRAMVAAGHEAVIHGYFHQRGRRANESFADKITTRFYTADEGEFYDIGEDEAFARVTKARGEFRQLGIEPAGFIAPAWLLSDAAERALKSAGIGHTTRLQTVTDLRAGRAHHSQSLVWSVRSGWRRACSLAWNASLFRRLAANPLLRIGLHPPDLHHPAVWRQALRLASRAVAEREAMTYESWFSRQAG